MDISVIIPTYNEAPNVLPLHKELSSVLANLGRETEIIFIDDGSTDGTFEAMQEAHAKDPSIKIIKFKRNFGQTAAMDAGFKHASGSIIVTMDADLQNDPVEIPRLITKLEEGYDVVSGWRKNRKDNLSKRFLSAGANVLRKLLIRDSIHDSGCTLKAYRQKAIAGLDLYGEMHRFIPAIVHMRGGKITEIVVNHRPRTAGTTKYKLSRVLKGFMDMLVIKFWTEYGTRPAHLFGGVGLCTSALGFIIAVILSIQKIFFGAALSNRPLLLLAVLLLILGTQLIMFGFLADMMVKIYYRRGETSPYTIEEII